MEKISQKQKAVADEIVAQGRKLGVAQHLIDAAVKFAYIESRLGRHMQNKNAFGVFQYMPDRWRERHSKAGARSSTSTQIAAMFRDLAEFEQRYNDHSNQAIPRKSVTLEEYLYIKHHDGSNSEAFVPGLNHRGNPNGLMVYRRDNPTYDASKIFPPEKTSDAPIRNPLEVTFGPLLGLDAIDWSGFHAEMARGQAVMSRGGSPSTSTPEAEAPQTSFAWPVVNDHTRWTPAPAPSRSYIDTHHFDPDTGASVSRRIRRHASLLAEAMASQPPSGQGLGASSDPWTSPRPISANLQFAGSA